MFEYDLYDIIKMRVCMCLNALSILLLEWELVSVWMRFIWYYLIEEFYVSQCAFNENIGLRAGMCLNTLHMILLK